MRHLMIDIETLDTSRKAVVLSYAHIVFCPKTGTEFAHHMTTLPIQYQLDYGRTISESTLRFWLDQKPEILKEQMLHAEDWNIVKLRSVLDYEIDSCDCVWANSPTFDLIILEDLFACYGEKLPAYFRKQRDVRTVRGTLPAMWEVKKTAWTTHSPIADCRSQIEDVVEFYKLNPGAADLER